MKLPNSMKTRACHFFLIYPNPLHTPSLKLPPLLSWTSVRHRELLWGKPSSSIFFLCLLVYVFRWTYSVSSFSPYHPSSTPHVPSFTVAACSLLHHCCWTLDNNHCGPHSPPSPPPPLRHRCPIPLALSLLLSHHRHPSFFLTVLHRPNSPPPTLH